jgi:DHA1 family multidrug resistance protein-like MFS transporter
MSFNETFFGILLHPWLKRHPAFQYLDERSSYAPPESFMPGFKTHGQRTDMVEKGAASSTLVSQKTTQEDCAHTSPLNSPQEGPPTAADMDSDPYLVDWSGPDDRDNPYSWPTWRKGLFLFQIMLLTTSVYMGSSIVSPAVPTMAEYWHVGFPTASLSISLFVLGYGIGPMLGICSASEIPIIGRTIPYMLSLTVFVILQVPTAIVDSVGGFMVLRFLGGFFGSPPLATGGASVQDVWKPATASLAMGMWGISAAAGPVSARPEAFFFSCCSRSNNLAHTHRSWVL